jgi:hypothetical protein
MKINIERDRPIINILGEICWGFALENFERKIGAKKETVEALLERLLIEEKIGTVETYLNNSEIEVIKKALTEVEKEIEEWEFQIRIGASLEEVKKISIFLPEEYFPGAGD